MPVLAPPGPTPVGLAAGRADGGEIGPLWSLVEGSARLDRETGSSRLPVQLALPGDLVGSELALMVDTKSETVCRALAQLLPPRRRKSGPARLHPVPSIGPMVFAWASPNVSQKAMA
jgi:hypothetical protein